VKYTAKDLTTGDIARYCQTTHFTVNKWIKAGKLRAYRTPGGHHRVSQKNFLAFLDAYELPVPEDFVLQVAPRILVVDDDPGVVEVLCLALRKQGYRVATATDGYDAGLKMATFEPQLLILDLVMPRLNGFELCTRVKADPLTQHIRIIAITAFITGDNMQRAIAAGADSCLGKPFHIDEVLREVRRLLRRRRVPSEAARR
jgi:excisionase family DNA binding protein